MSGTGLTAAILTLIVIMVVVSFWRQILTFLLFMIVMVFCFGIYYVASTIAYWI